MERLKSLFLNSKNISRESYLWNTIQSILFATQSVFMLMIITRVAGLDAAGVFSIAYAIGSLMYYVGEFGARKFQITDVDEKYSFRDYHTHRVITCTTSAVISVAYALFGLAIGRYSSDKTAVIVIICLIKAVEAYCDVFFSRYQQKHRLDVAAKASTYRLVLSLVVSIAVLVVTKDLLISMIAWLIANIVTTATSFILVVGEFGKIEFGFIKKQFLGITKECLPLFAGSFLLLYVGNAPKYAIDAIMDDASQACYNFIFMPVFAIGMLANFIFNPILVELAEHWTNNEQQKFNRIVYRQIAIIGGITLLAIGVALTIGCPVLGIIFGADLKGYEMSLTILMVGGGMLALANFFIVVITVVRGQKYLLVGYIVAAVSAKLCSAFFVKNYGIWGATVLYATLMTLISTIFAVTLLLCVKSRKKGRVAADAE